MLGTPPKRKDYPDLKIALHYGGEDLALASPPKPLWVCSATKKIGSMGGGLKIVTAQGEDVEDRLPWSFPE
jgi:hypothetical protein